ncbi:MAG: acetyl-CoA acetyltransferase [Myxococcota bacterium]|nr:acetyl-CoA acetyltransferase [Myxococcota bacterium]
MDSSRIPVLVGIAQVDQRSDEPNDYQEPLDMMLKAIRLAAEDSERTEILSRTDAVYVIKGLWSYEDPAGAIAREIGAEKAETIGTAYGGNMVQSCVSDACLAISRGELSVAILTGAEIGRSLAQARKSGTRLKMREAGGSSDRLMGEMKTMLHPLEEKHGVVQPVYWYSIFDSAIRHQRGESIDEHRKRISELWASFSDVAAGNPHAWIREKIDAEEIRTPSSDNRMIGFPYTKLMNANSRVNQGAALILCSLHQAEKLGIPPEKYVFPHSGSEAHDPLFLSNRNDFHSSPAIRTAGEKVLELSGVGVDDLAHVDLYSCFPSAVQVAATELGLSQQRPLSVTGGLTFGGGPLNDYVMHSVTRMAEILRDDAGSYGLVTANGGALTKHALNIYSSRMPEQGFQYACVQNEVDSFGQREIMDDQEGEVTIEAYTVAYDADGPARAIAACRLDDGRRTWATREDASLASAMTTEEFCGHSAHRSREGLLTPH